MDDVTLLDELVVRVLVDVTMVMVHVLVDDAVVLKIVVCDVHLTSNVDFTFQGQTTCQQFIRIFVGG